MLQEIKINDLSEKKWNAAASRQSTVPYSQLFYLNAVHNHYHYLVWNDYDEVFALPIVKKYGFPFSLQPFICQRFAKVSTSFLNEIILFAKRVSLLSILNLEMNVDSKIQAIRNQNFILPLTSNYKNIAQFYNSHTNRNLKKSTQLSYQKVAHADEIIQIFKSKQSEKYAVKPAFFDVLNRVIQIKELQFSFYHAIHNKTICGGTIWLIFNKRHLLLMFAQNELGRQQSSTYFLIDQYIKENAESDVLIDFEGSNHEGIANMLKGFGAEPEYYYTLKFGFFSFLK
jgi:hypothetical protein